MMKILYHSQNDDYMALISLDKANAFDGKNKQLLVDESTNLYQRLLTWFFLTIY